MDRHLHARRPRAWWAGALALGMLVGGCGAVRQAPTPSGTSSTASSTSAASSAGTSSTTTAQSGAQYASYYKINGTATLRSGSPLSMDAGDFTFSPNTLTAKVGTPVHIQVHNVAPEPHNFSLPEFGVNVTLPAGKTTTVNFTPNRAGTYYFYCNLPGHPAAGMVGKLTVA